MGADEVDMVIDRGAFLSGRYAKVYDEIVQVKQACGEAHLKVILEVAELGTYDNVRRASLLAMAAGADFIKTSTGKLSGAATLPVTLCMLEAIRDVHEETGRMVGMKPAGGIRQAKQAVQYLVQLYETLGAEWLTPDLYRLGASTLLNDVLMQIRKERTGRYQSARTTSPLTELEKKKASSALVPSEWDYAPAPESRDIVRIDERYGHFVGGEWLEPRETYTTISPATRGAARRGRPGDAGGGARRDRRRARGVRERLVVAARLGAREVPVPDRADPPGALARVRGARVAERRQADQGVARRRPAARGRALLLLRGLGRQARVRVPEPRARGRSASPGRSSRGTSRC